MAAQVQRKGGKKNRKWGRGARAANRLAGAVVGMKGEAGLRASRVFDHKLGCYVAKDRREVIIAGLMKAA